MIQVTTGQLSTARFKVDDEGIAVLSIDNPPVNALSHHVRIALCDGVERALRDEAVRALVLICAGRTFFAGADVKELSKPIEPPLLADVMASFEASKKPIIAAMHGTALGGGFEIALAAHFRVAVPSAVVGLPEVTLGLLPGAGGTQRAPRLVGVAAAVEMIGLGRHVGAAEALELGLIDAIVDENDLDAGAVAFARTMLEEGRLRRVRDISLETNPNELAGIFSAFREAHPDMFVGLKAPEGALKAIEAAATLPFDEGMEKEREIARALTASPESAAQRHLFFAERTAAKLPGAANPKVPAPSGVTIRGEGDPAMHLRASGVAEGSDAVVLCDEGDPDAYGAALAKTEAELVIVTRHLGDFPALQAMARDPARLVGLEVSDGRWEIVVGESTSSDAALATMALAHELGVPAIFVKPGPAYVRDRIARALTDSVARLVASGRRRSDVIASARKYGFGEKALDGSAEDGRSCEELAEALVAGVAREGLALEEEGRIYRSSDIDFAAVKSGLWPLWRGGPAFAAQVMGRQRVEALCADPARSH